MGQQCPPDTNWQQLVFLTGYSGYDPEVNAGRTTSGVPSLGIGWTTYPMARSLSLGVAVDF